ncbi:hypothetical protein PTT_18391 [Pyrenophora teres f. teres 0-1]|uniref:Apple domain-containing protein n=1 Tax=Pyrenophora teres f. teres (strain 0-1) TaxID=861557 RepID=E3S6M1_PYRTT|nr:hypothetical protein PTT_18391 [Pyrenophora teres f. teres 0-1]
MRLSLVCVAALAASIEAAAFERRQDGYPDVSDCDLDAFEGHTSEALLFCSNILKSGTATATVIKSYTTTTTTTKKTTVTIRTTPTPTPTPTLTPTPTSTPTSKPSSSTTPPPPPPSSSTPKPSPSSSAPPPPPPSSSTPKPPPSSSSVPPPPPSSSSVPKPSSSPTPVQPSSTLVSSTLVSSPSPTPTGSPSCGIAGYVKTTAAYYFESSGTKNTFAACSALCKADTKCKSFGYGEANCMLFDVAAVDNTNLNPSSPYTFYDATCPSEVPVGKRSPQLDISFGLPAGINISLDLGPKGISSACSCLIISGPASTTVTRTQSSAIVTTATVTSTTTRTIGAA